MLASSMLDARNYPASRIVQHYQSAIGRFADFTSLLALGSRGFASLHPGLYAIGRSAGFFASCWTWVLGFHALHLHVGSPVEQLGWGARLYAAARSAGSAFQFPQFTLSKQSVLISPSDVDNNSNTDLLRSSLQQHLEAIRALLDSKLTDIEQAGLLIVSTLAAGNKVLLCGNGGSAADAQHIAAELVGRYELHRRAFPAIALTTDTSALTAISNDYGYEGVFARQVEALAVSGDVLIAISTSGHSANVIKAVEMARRLSCKTIALTGCSGEPLASKCDIAVVVPSGRTSRVQEAHITIGHLWCEMLDAASESSGK